MALLHSLSPARGVLGYRTSNFKFTYGNGYFNEGTQVPDHFFFQTGYTGQGQPGWQKNFVGYYILTPQHAVVDSGMVTWTVAGYSGDFVMDMGEVPPGSYAEIEIGYLTATGRHIAGTMNIPILIRPMLTPTLTGDFGPFLQAIAPGTMARPNTFSIFTPGLTDLSAVTGVFYDSQGTELKTVNAVQTNDTIWQITADMATLAPPQSTLIVNYYLGAAHYLAATAGPYPIGITRTRPAWFDAIGDTAFRDIQENGDVITFQVTTPFDSSYIYNNSSAMSVPGWVPLIHGSNCSINMPTADAYLKFTISQLKLELNQPPKFFQKVFNIGMGMPSVLAMGFNYGQNNSYSLDANNNLLATQNFTAGGSLTSGFTSLASIAKRVKETILLAGSANPSSIIVSPTFSFQAIGAFQYAGRQHLTVDTLTGSWGDTGNLDVDADPSHTQAYAGSASYHFYGGSLGVEFSLGVQLLKGLVSGNFGLDAQIDLGFGHSYVSIPKYKSKPLKSLAFQIYGRFYVDVLWGWYEKTLWGPSLFYSHDIFGDDMSHCFPPDDKKMLRAGLLASGGDNPAMADTIYPASPYTGAPLPVPQATIRTGDGKILFHWTEPGIKYGERRLAGRTLDRQSRRFSKLRTVSLNLNALNNPACDQWGDSVAIVAWAQSRHTPGSFLQSTPADPLTEFIRSQDIWYSVSDISKDTTLKISRISDDLTTVTSGRAEGNPKVIFLDANRAMIVWQTLSVQSDTGSIRYTLLERQSGSWTGNEGSIAVGTADVKSSIRIARTGDGRLVMAWLDIRSDDPLHTTILSSQFDGSSWSVPASVTGGSGDYCNYFDLAFRNGYGGLVYTRFIEDTVNGHREKVMLVPWQDGHWNTAQQQELVTDSVRHLQLPRLIVRDDGSAVVAVKRERFTRKLPGREISRIDLFRGSLANPSGPWRLAAASPFVCDTLRQVSEFNLEFTGGDTLVAISQEHGMSASNFHPDPVNGRVFGDPYMNQVIRFFTMSGDGTVTDVDEEPYFAGLPKPAGDAGRELMECFPNPCRDHTVVRFALPAAGRAVMELFDLRGTRVAILADRDLAAGSYDLKVNTGMLAAGVYMCRLKCGVHHASLKIVVDR